MVLFFVNIFTRPICKNTLNDKPFSYLMTDKCSIASDDHFGGPQSDWEKNVVWIERFFSTNEWNAEKENLLEKVKAKSSEETKFIMSREEFYTVKWDKECILSGFTVTKRKYSRFFKNLPSERSWGRILRVKILHLETCKLKNDLHSAEN